MKVDITFLTDRKNSFPASIIDVGIKDNKPESYLLEINTGSEIYYNCLRESDPYISKESFETLQRIVKDTDVYYQSFGLAMCERFQLPPADFKPLPFEKLRKSIKGQGLKYE